MILKALILHRLKINDYTIMKCNLNNLNKGRSRISVFRTHINQKRELMKNTIKPLIIAGILSGLSACTAITDVTSSTSSTLDAVTPDVTLNRFVDQRYVAIRKDAARGAGENIDALAQLMGKQDKKAFAVWMQGNYDELFTGLDKPVDLIARIKEQSLTDKG